MRNHSTLLSIIAVLLLCQTPSFADPMDGPTFSFIQNETKTTFFNVCKQSLPAATDAVCSCLGANTVTYLDNNALMQCDIKDSQCIQKIVEAAGLKAFSKEGIASCVKQSETPSN